MGEFSKHHTLLCAASVAVALAPGCGDSGESGSTDADSAAAELRSDGAPRELVERCFWEGREEVPEAAMRAEFADPAEGEVRLLLSDPTVRPGQILSAAVANDSPDSVRYGTTSHVESEGGERVRIDGPYGFRAILLGAEARAVGPCVTLPVPSSTPPGRYVAVLDDGTAKLRAEFEVAGQAISNPAWEVSLRRGRPDNRSR